MSNMRHINENYYLHIFLWNLQLQVFFYQQLRLNLENEQPLIVTTQLSYYWLKDGPDAVTVTGGQIKQSGDYNFTHDAVFKNIGKNLYEYIEKYILKSGNTIKRKRELHIIPKETIMKKLLSNNFKLYHKESLPGIDDYSLYFLKKNN